ncbi:DUF2913 family protein [Serratia fonticola]|uniref:DUF2913 family protein n=1 Tax=Serratia fonticola TaxID=47917 RepID=UPI00192CE57E|nr:DUF2913 family protein [Serratia fonticola]
MVTPDEWDSQALDDAAPALYVIKAALQSAFTSEGQLVTPLEFKVVGDMQTVVDALVANGMTADFLGKMVTLMP